MEVVIKSNIEQVTKNLSRIQRKQIPFATSMAINDTAFGLQKEIKRQMPIKLDRPTPWTISGVLVRKSKKTDLEAYVYMAGARGLPKSSLDRNQYIKYQVSGGTRHPKKRKIPVPYKNIKANKYGSMPKGKVKSLIAKRDVFVGNVKGIDGIWQRGHYDQSGAFYTTKGRASSVRLLVAFENNADYKPKLPYQRISEGYTAHKFEPNFRRALAKALASAKD
jgi:hypothetical protein